MLSKQVVQYSPVVGNPLVPPSGQQIAREVQYNSIGAAPMIRQDMVIGAILCLHHEPKVFNGKEVGLIKAFAAQAVIAIENARLFEELRERTGEVEKLNQQLEQRVADQVGEIERMGRLRRFPSSAGG
jgi:GAF domain-containing protein